MKTRVKRIVLLIDTFSQVTLENIQERSIPVPLQEIGSDCGLVFLHFIQKFVDKLFWL
jgi:Ulp1 family protease